MLQANSRDLIEALKQCSGSFVDDHNGKNETLTAVCVYRRDGREYVCPVFINTQFCLNPLEFKQDAIHLSKWSVGGTIDNRGRAWDKGDVTDMVGTIVRYHAIGGKPGSHDRLEDLVQEPTFDEMVAELERRDMVKSGPDLSQVSSGRFGGQVSVARQEMFLGHRAQMDLRPISKLSDDELMDRYLNMPSNAPDMVALNEVKMRMEERAEFRARVLALAEKVGVDVPDVVKQMDGGIIDGEKVGDRRPTPVRSYGELSDYEMRMRERGINPVASDETLRELLDTEGVSSPVERRNPEIRVLMSNEAIIKRLVGPWDGEGWDEGMSEETRLKRIALAEAMGASPETMQNRRELSPIDPESMRDVLSIFPMQAEGVKNEEEQVKKVVCTSAQVAEGESVFDADGKRWTKVHGRMVPEGMVQAVLSSIHLDRGEHKPFPDISDPLVTWESIENLPGVKGLLLACTQEEIQKAATWMRNEAGPVSEASFSKFLHQVLQVHYPKMTPGPFGFMTHVRDIESTIFEKPVLASYLDGLDKLHDVAVEKTTDFKTKN